MIESAFATAKNFSIHIYVADDDPEMDAYNELSKSFGLEYNVFWYHGIDYPTVYKWNYLEQLAKTYDPDLYMLAADDIIFATPGWDTALMQHYNKLENKIRVYHLRDSRDDNGTPHVIVTREYVGAMGYFMPPIFLHWFIDTWTVEIAKATGSFTHFKEYELVHDKSSDRGKPDKTHNRIRQMGWHARDQAVNDSCQHFLEYEKLRLAKVVQ